MIQFTLSKRPIIFCLICSALWFKHLFLILGNSFLISSPGTLSSGLNIKYINLNIKKLFLDGLFGFLNFSKSSFLIFSASFLAAIFAGSASAKALSASSFSFAAWAEAAIASLVAASTIAFSPLIFSFSTSNLAKTSLVFFFSSSTITVFASISFLRPAIDSAAFATTANPFSKRCIWLIISPSFLATNSWKYLTNSKNDLGVV